MKAVHLSDTHGTFPELPKEAEIVLHTGDFCPNFLRSGMCIPQWEAADQRAWLREKAFTIAKWLHGRPLLVVQGNHDFTAITGPGVKDITNSTISRGGLVFHGFPYVPAFGPWNWGCSPAVLHQKTQEIPQCDVLMAHCPPRDILDSCPSGHIGNSYLTDALDKLESLPKWLLCGHVHESGGGIAHHYEMKILNNATTMRLFDL